MTSGEAIASALTTAHTVDVTVALPSPTSTVYSPSGALTV
jgi:hypothetical protein